MSLFKHLGTYKILVTTFPKMPKTHQAGLSSLTYKNIISFVILSKLSGALSGILRTHIILK